ncbi:uncharacterized protein LOC103953160 [Pyrus x bretschneideri]|uniref:uncharacterized protein LOC103953160 n=1 Tax=Pyrus x bretschneideri TaxID=225117 RepID=UPI002030018B|nr:uncharacterized protein LOC103953160 [Pyrus x bretschneideri]
MPKPSAFLRQLSGREAWKSKSMMWGDVGNNKSCGGFSGGVGLSEGKGGSFQQMEGLQNMYGNNNGGGGGGFGMRKRVMVVVDDSSHSKHAMMWALSHVANKGDLLTLLHIIPSSHDSSSTSSPSLANSLGSLCKACKPEVEVEALVIQGPRVATVNSQVKKLEVSVLVLGQKKPSPLFSCLFGTSSTEDFVEHCINNAECLTIGVRKQSRGVSGYLINTRWQKDFWLLA